VFEGIWYGISLLGTPEMWGAVAGVLVLSYLFLRRRGKHAKFKGFVFVFVISLFLVFGLVQGLKTLTGVPRPCGLENPHCPPEGGYAYSSFPSGHSASGFVVFTSLFLAFRRKKYLPVFVLPLLVAWSRVALGVHTPVDVFAGSIIGLGITLLVWNILRLNPPRRAVF
jgi:membrane-associated phospholipid phosphatase